MIKLSASYVLACKLKALKGDLKHWNKHVFGDVAFRMKCLLTELLELDMREKLQVLSLVDRSRRTVIRADMEHLASLEEISWRQKSKVLFIKEGIIILGFSIGWLTHTGEPIKLGEWRLKVCFMDDREVQA